MLLFFYNKLDSLLLCLLFDHYRYNGYYTVTLTAFNELDCADTIQKTISPEAFGVRGASMSANSTRDVLSTSAP